MAPVGSPRSPAAARGPAARALSPADREGRAALARDLARELTARAVDVVALSWVDTAGISRVKAVPTYRLEHAAAWGVGASPTFDTFTVLDSTPVGQFAGGPVGDLRLHPDLARLTTLSATPGWAWAPAERRGLDGLPHPLDARELARAEHERLGERGFTARVAFEIEWVVAAGGDGGAEDGGDRGGFTPAGPAPAYGLTRLVALGGYLRRIVATLTDAGLSVEQIHPEYAPGQYEVSIAATDPVGAADDLVLARETIRAVSAEFGLRASFAPKVDAAGVGNGGHVHFSLWRDGQNLMAGGDGPAGMTAEAETATAAILVRLPALLALGAPSVASYLRLVPSHWAGAYACWGVENREAALRFVPGAAGERARAANLEVKPFDAAANPYLLLAGLLVVVRAALAAGEGRRLPAPVAADPAGLAEGERARLGITRLPATLGEATAALLADPVLGAGLGEAWLDTVATVRRAEIDLFAGASAEQVVAATRWRY
jgi:glutamine synthetase